MIIKSVVPERLNLAIGNSCYINCPGCYQMFGNKKVDLNKILQSVSRFSEMGIRRVTVSGGDPLLIENLLAFLSKLKSLRISDIKLDTVGLGFLKFNNEADSMTLDTLKTEQFLKLLTTLGLPLDGWDTPSLKKYRVGRANLFNEISFLLEQLSLLKSQPCVTINTVAHAYNIDDLWKIHEVLIEYPIIKDWHIFQYTPTDQAGTKANDNFIISDAQFDFGKKQLIKKQRDKALVLPTSFYSNRDRLGWYLLINSDGEAWIPDKNGATIQLGEIFGRESEILDRWAEERAKIKLPLAL